MNLGHAEALTISLIKDGQAFDVQSLKFNSRLHQDYEIIAEVISTDTAHNTFAAQRCFTTGAWYQVLLRFAVQNKSMLLQGVCTELIGSGTYIHGQELQIITLRSELFPLFNNQRSGIYYGGNLLDIIDKGLIALAGDNKLTQHTQFVKNLTQNTELAYPPQLSLTQYLEADMAFILRQMRQFGAWFNFYQALMLDAEASPANAPKVTATLGDTNAAFMRYPEQVSILDPAESQGKGIYELQYSEGGTALGQIEGIYYDEISGKTLSCIPKIPDGQAYRKAQYILPHTALTQTQMQYQTQVDADSLAIRQKAFALLDPAPFVEQTAVIDGLNLRFAKHNATLWETIQDPGVGWSFAAPAAIIKFMGAQGIKIGGTYQGMLSIYHMANLFRYPLGYIFEGTEADLVIYYNDWKNKFSTFAALDPKSGEDIQIPMKAENGILVYKYDPKAQTLSQIWAPKVTWLDKL